MVKIAFIGAGSVVFTRNLTRDLLGLPELSDCTLAFMDIDKERLEVSGRLAHKVARAVGVKPTIVTTMDQRQAVQAADFVINMVQVGGFDATLLDFEIPRRHGLTFTIGDTTGPGGLFRALRTYPMLNRLCRDMEQVCPNAYLLNYSNPMSMNMQTISRTSTVSAIGLCHSVQGTLDKLMEYLGEKASDVNFICAGINHMAFYLRLEKQGQDLYPRLFEAMNNQTIFRTNKVRFELMRRLGHFVTESSEHQAEYNPWFIPHGLEMITQFSVPIDEYLHRCGDIIDEFEKLKKFAHSDEEMKGLCRSHEYGSTIVHSIITGKPSVVYGNMPNHGLIDNLPVTAIVEGPTLVDRTGFHYSHVGDMPPQLVGYIQGHIVQHELFIRAAYEGRRDHIYQACMLDPLTAATLSLDRIVEMCDELITCHGGQLPGLDTKRTLVSGSGKQFEVIDTQQLHNNWNSIVNKKNFYKTELIKNYIKKWKIIGPFTGEQIKSSGIEAITQLERDFSNRHDGFVDVALRYALQGDNHSLTLESVPVISTEPMAPVIGSTAGWKDATAFASLGKVDLVNSIGRMNHALAYGFTIIESAYAGETTFYCGSSGGVKIWINGMVVHESDVNRGFKVAEDRFTGCLQAGRNSLMLKIHNFTGDWGFGLIMVPISSSGVYGLTVAKFLNPPFRPL